MDSSDQDKSFVDQDNKIIAVWWQDRRDVLALSTMHNTSVSEVLSDQRDVVKKDHCHARPLLLITTNTWVVSTSWTSTLATIR